LRPIPLSDVYSEVDRCRYTYNGRKFHPDYVKTSFSISEYELLKENNEETRLNEKVPDFKKTDLELNNYTMYTLSYPSWTMECQSTYSTE